MNWKDQGLIRKGNGRRGSQEQAAKMSLKKGKSGGRTLDSWLAFLSFLPSLPSISSFSSSLPLRLFLSPPPQSLPNKKFYRPTIFILCSFTLLPNNLPTCYWMRSEIAGAKEQ